MITKNQIQSFKIHYLCDKCCSEMISTDKVILTLPPKYEHKCNNCNNIENLDKKYPYTEYEEYNQ